MHISRTLLYGTALLTVALWSSTAGGQSAEQRYLDGLRGRGLSRLAEAYCRDQLTRSDLAPVRRADLTVELARSLSDRALSSSSTERGPYWDRARKAIEDFVRKYPQNPRLPMVRLQGALGLLTRGELARQESELVADPKTPLEEARSYLSKAIEGLRRSQEEADMLQRRRNQLPRSDKSILSVGELAELQKTIRYETARAYRNQAQCYGRDSPDRANALGQAIKLLQPLVTLDPTDPLCFKSRIDLIRCYRLQGEYVKGNQAAEALLKLEPSPRVKLQLVAEHIQILLAAGQLAPATEMLQQPRELYGITVPELDLAWLEIQLTAAAQARKAGAPFAGKDARDWEELATAMAEEIEKLYGPYWTRRAGMLLSGHFGEVPEGSDNIDMLVRVAESLYRSGKFDEAVGMYDKARAKAAAQGSKDNAFDMGYIAAAIKNKQEQYDLAMIRFRELALAFPRNPRAAEAHQMAVYLAGQALKKEYASREEFDRQLALYQQLMQEHLETGKWPDSQSADEIRFLLGRMRQLGQQWEEAIGLYRAIPRGSPQFFDAAKAAAQCYQTWLRGLKAAGKPTDQIAGDGAEWFKSLMSDAQGRLPQKWSPVERFAALESARLRLNFTSTGYVEAQQVLSTALQNSADATPDWIAAARALLVFSLAGQGRANEAAAVLAEISAGPTAQLLSLLEGLGRVAGEAPPQIRHQLAKLQLDTINLVMKRESELSAADRRNIERVRAKVLAETGRHEDALAAYHALAKDFPNSGDVQEEYLRLLMERNDRESLELAVQKCREIEKKSRPQSPRWFLAKYNLALLHYRLGNRQKAAKMIELLKLLHPNLGGREMKAKFETLLKECR